MTTDTHEIATYLRYDPYDLADRDVNIRGRTTQVVRTRKVHRCVPPLSDPHDIPAGTMCWKETAFVDDVPCANYVCLACMDKWIAEVQST